MTLQTGVVTTRLQNGFMQPSGIQDIIQREKLHAGQHYKE